MFSTTELLIISGIVVFLLGPSKLPELARSLGAAIAEFKKASNGEIENHEEKRK